DAMSNPRACAFLAGGPRAGRVDSDGAGLGAARCPAGPGASPMRTPTLARLATLALLPLAMPAVLAPPAVAGPPGGVSGRMVYVDEVADGLRKYRAARDDGKRAELLGKLARTRDPRVAVALGEALHDPSPDVLVRAAYGIVRYHTGWHSGE